MPSIQKPALKSLYTELTKNPDSKVDTAILDKIVAIVGDKKTFGVTTTTSAKVEAKLKDGNLSREQKLEIAKHGLDADEKADLKALLADPAFAKRLDPAGANFLKALVGLEALANVDQMQRAATRTEAPKPPPTPEAIAAGQMRDLVKSGKLQGYYDAVIGAVDNPALKAEALALFAKLPVVKPGMSAEEFVKAGLWKVAPRGVEEMQKSARYLPGRQVLVETRVHSKVPSRSDPTYDQQRRNIGTADANGTMAVTYRGVLKGEDPNNNRNFIVLVDGPNGGPAVEVSVTKESIFSHNQPHDLGARYIESDTKRNLPYNSDTWSMDYASPLAKAKLCEVALLMDEHVAKLDFSKQSTTAPDGQLAVFGRGEVAKKMVEIQKSCVEIVFRSINMRYPHGTEDTSGGRVGSGVRDVARQAIKGTGMCVQQSTVMGGLLTPFMDVLGIDGQYRSGNCFRNIRGATNNVYAPDYESGHGWWQITFRPSMEMTVTDRTWNQVNHSLDEAYGFPYGDRYANTNIIGFRPRAANATDVDVSGKVTVQTFERQFSQVGDGRENHISLTQDG